MNLSNLKDYYCIDQQFRIDLDYEKLRIKENIDQKKGISIKFYSLPSEIEFLIQHTLNTILEKYNNLEKEDAVFNVIFESIVNGLKANAKKLFFMEHGFAIYNPDDYAKGMALFKKSIPKLNFKDVHGINKDKKFHVQLTFTHNTKGLYIAVFNNTLILPSEEQRVKQKLDEGRKYKDLMSFYKNCPDASEGEGLGLVLSLILLQAIGIDSSLFTIGTENGYTFAKIEIPFTI